MIQETDDTWKAGAGHPPSSHLLVQILPELESLTLSVQQTSKTEHVRCKLVLSDKIQSDATYIIDLRDIIYRQCTADAQNLGAQSRYQC